MTRYLQQTMKGGIVYFGFNPWSADSIAFWAPGKQNILVGRCGGTDLRVTWSWGAGEGMPLWSDFPPQASTSYRLCHSSVVLYVSNTALEVRAFSIWTSGDIQDKNHEYLHDILQWTRVHAQTLLLTKSVLTSAGQQEKPERGERWLRPSRWPVYPVGRNLWFDLFWFVLCFQYLALASLDT